MLSCHENEVSCNGKLGGEIDNEVLWCIVLFLPVIACESINYLGMILQWHAIECLIFMSEKYKGYYNTWMHP